MHARSLVLPLLFAAAVLTAFFFVDLSQLSNPLDSFSQTPDNSVQLAEKYGPLTLAYQDPILGFSFRYPIGYPLEVQEGVSATFYASGPNGISEAFYWLVANETYSVDDLKDAAAELNGELVSMRKIDVDGKNALRLQYALPAAEVGEPAQLIQGWIPCGNYSLYLSAIIPQSLSDDVDLADYTLTTARCG